jgi:hypothetical protein
MIAMRSIFGRRFQLPPAVRCRDRAMDQDLIAGRIDYQCPNTTVTLPQIESATIKPIAILTRDRSPILPDLASTHEQGLTDFEASIWYAFFLPKGTPAAIVRKLHDAAVATMETPSVRARLREIGATVVAPERRSPGTICRNSSRAKSRNGRFPSGRRTSRGSEAAAAAARGLRAVLAVMCGLG